MKLWPRVWCLVFLTHGVDIYSGLLALHRYLGDAAGKMVQLHKFSRRELAEKAMTCAIMHCHEKVTLPSDNFRQCFCLITTSNLNVGTA